MTTDFQRDIPHGAYSGRGELFLPLLLTLGIPLNQSIFRLVQRVWECRKESKMNHRMPCQLDIPMLAKRWNKSRRTIERKIHSGEIPPPSLFLGHKAWPLEVIREFERNHFGKELA